MKTKKLKIGKTNLESYPFVFGGNVFGWTSDEKISFDILNEYVAKDYKTLVEKNELSVSEEELKVLNEE